MEHPKICFSRALTFGRVKDSSAMYRIAKNGVCVDKASNGKLSKPVQPEIGYAGVGLNLGAVKRAIASLQT